MDSFDNFSVTYGALIAPVLIASPRNFLSCFMIWFACGVRLASCVLPAGDGRGSGDDLQGSQRPRDDSSRQRVHRAEVGNSHDFGGPVRPVREFQPLLLSLLLLPLVLVLLPLSYVFTSAKAHKAAFPC